MNRSGSGIFSGYIAHDPDGPYGYHRESYPDPRVRAIIENLGGVDLPMKYNNITNLFEGKYITKDPYLLLVLGWVCLQMLDTDRGFSFLIQAQEMAGGVGADTAVDARISEIRMAIEKRGVLDKELWSIAGEDNEFTTYWRPFHLFTPPTGEGLLEIRSSIDELRKKRKELDDVFGPSKISSSLLNLASIDTNEIERVFHITSSSRRILIAHGFHTPSIIIARATTTYQSTNPKTVGQIANDTHSAFELATSRAKTLLTHPLTLADICQLHATILTHSCLKVPSSGPILLVAPGRIRTFSISIHTPRTEGNGSFLVQVCPPWNLSSELSRLINTINLLLRDANGDVAMTLSISIWAHCAFENIHPFGDGNGRVGRLLATMIAASVGLEPMTVAPGREQCGYIDALREWERTMGDVGPSIRRYFDCVGNAFARVEEVLLEQPKLLRAWPKTTFNRVLLARRIAGGYG